MCLAASSHLWLKVLSIWQPWAAFILADRPGWKNIENRTWPTRYRGWLYIHAAAHRPTTAENRHASELVTKAGLFLPGGELTMQFGGIIGMVKLVDCVRKHKSPWFEGPWGWVFEEPYPLPFEPCAGQRGLWDYGSFPTLKSPKAAKV